MLLKANIVFELLSYGQQLCPQGSNAFRRIMQNVSEVGR